MMNGVYTIDEIRERIIPIAKRFDIQRVILFGSYARGEATAESDIDLIIELPEAVGLFRLAEIFDAIQAALDKNVDCLTENSIPLSLRFETLDDEVLLYAA